MNEGVRVGAEISRDFPNRYAGMSVEDFGGKSKIVIKLTGGAEALLSRYTSNPEIEAVTAKFSLQQLQNKQDRLAQTLRDTSESYVVAVDQSANKVVASLKRGGKAKVKLERDALLGEDLLVNEVDEPISATASVSGNKIDAMQRSTSTPAGGLWRDNASLGFAVAYGTGQRGYVTAAHFDECKPSSGIVLTSCTKN